MTFVYRLTLSVLCLPFFSTCDVVHTHGQHIEPTEKPHEIFASWEADELLPGGRFDAVAYLGNETIIIGSRGENPGLVFRSTNGGRFWTGPVRVTDEQITCIANDRNGRVYLLTASSRFYRSDDYGKSWTYITQISEETSELGYALSYAVHVTDHGTLLVSDTRAEGGSVYRSTDGGETWKLAARLSDRGLYRFVRTGNGILVNGWAGQVYRTQDDGVSWELLADVTDSPLYATEYIGRHVTLQASESGRIFRSDTYGQTWSELDVHVEPADDLVKLGHGAVLLSTYSGARNMYISVDNALTWQNIGPLNTGASDDWFDHAIYIDEPDAVVIIGVTNKGYAVRATVERAALADLGTYQNTIADEPGNKFHEKLRGYIVDPVEINEPEDVVLHNGYAYLPNRDGNSIAVIDVANPGKPQLTASIRSPQMLDMFGVDVEGDYLYAVSMSNNTLVIYNIANPTQPVFASALQIGGIGSYGQTPDVHARASYAHTRLRKVHVQNGYAYVTHNNEGRLYVVDVREPSRPAVTGSASTGDGAFAVMVHGEIAYVAGCFPGQSVVAFDIRDKSNPRRLKKIKDEKSMRCTCDFQIADHYLFATGWSDNTLLVFNISDPTNFELETVYRHDYIRGPSRLIVHNQKAYIINTVNSSMTVVDVADPRRPEFEYFISDLLMQTAYGIDIDDVFIYLAGRDAKSFLILDK